MKKFLLSIFAVLFAFAGVQAGEYTYTFSAKQFTANGTKTLGNVDWTLAGDGGFWGYDGTKGQQFGSGNKPYKTLTLSTSGISGTITKIVVNTSGASSINASFTVSVGGTQYGSSTKLTTSATAYTFTGTASGDIELSYTQTSSKAIYIKSISVTYEAGGGGGGTPVPTFNPVSGTTFEETLEVVITATDGAAIHYTLNGEEPNTDSEIYSDPIVIDETSTVKAIAVVDGVSSSVAEATYTKVKLIDLNGCSVADAIEAYGNGQTGNATIVGYIVGTMVDNKFVPGSEGAVAANLVIADDPNETDYSKCIPVQLSSGTIRDVLNLLDTPANLGRKVTLSGSLEKYFTVAGLKSLKTAGLYWNVSEAGYATLYLGYKVVIPETVKAYLATGVAGKYVALSEVTGILPANTGLILEGEGEHLFNITSSAATVDVEANLLTGTLTDTEITKGEGNSYYILANGEEGIGFYNPIYDGDENKFNNAANKAYLVVPAEQAEGIACYSFRFGEGTTGIENVTTENVNVTVIYDLTGRRVEAITAPGIYVVNGKKVLVK